MNRKQITVNTNDPQSPRIQLEVIADLEELLAASPNRQWFGQIKQNEKVTRPFVFEGKLLGDASLSDIRIKENSPNQTAYTWELKDAASETGRQLTLDVTVDSSKIQPGRFNDVLLISTGIKEIPQLELNLSGEIMGPISATPQRLYFGQFVVGQEMEKPITLTSNNGQPFRILNAVIDEKEFKIDPWNRDAATTHELKIRMMTDVPKDRIRTSLVVTTDMQAQPTLQVEVHAYQQRTRPTPPDKGPVNLRPSETGARLNERSVSSSPEKQPVAEDGKK